MARTRLSPICWATSAVMRDRLALELGVHLEREVDLGQRVGRELDVDDRAGDRDDATVLQRRSSRGCRRSWSWGHVAPG